MIYLGCDPGKSGAIAKLSEEGVVVYQMPATVHELITLMGLLGRLGEGNAIAVLERVAARQFIGRSSAFKLCYP